jgi:hypothetical protein
MANLPEKTTSRKSVLHKLMGAFNLVCAPYLTFMTFYEHGILGVLLLFGITGGVVGYVALNTDFFKGDDWIDVLTIINFVALISVLVGSQL